VPLPPALGPAEGTVKLAEKSLASRATDSLAKHLTLFAHGPFPLSPLRRAPISDPGC